MNKLLTIAAAVGVAAAMPALADAQGQGKGHGKGHSINPATCPPGLANRNPPCVPPGQARRLFREGQRIPSGYRYFVDYDAIPEAYRVRVPEGYRYIYRDDTVYVVDPATSLVRTIIDLID